jgi:hypothetical protein
MDTTFEDQAVETETESPSIKTSWGHCKQIWSASTRAEAWRSLKKTLETMPVWGFAVIAIVAITLAANSWLIVVPLLAGGLLGAVYLTVKQAVRSALREHDAARRSDEIA